MAQMNISIPDKLKAWVEQRVADGTYASISDYVRDLLRADQRLYEKGQPLAEAADPIPPEAGSTSLSNGANASVYSQELRHASATQTTPKDSLGSADQSEPFTFSWTGHVKTAPGARMTIKSPAIQR